VRDLEAVLAPDRVLARPLDRLGRSADASIYRLIPQVVVRPRDLAEMRGLFDYARRNARRLTFRTGGTSLSGQAVTDDVLVELPHHWNRARVLDGGRRVWSQPGVVGGRLNRMLAPMGCRIGPDPASIEAAMIGGIVANNSSGMCSGVAQNSYHTLEALTALLADGTLVDTAAADADERLRADAPVLYAGLASLRDRTRGNTALAERIRRKFARKNTTGYSLNALLDYDRPVDVLAHLLVGSEGTLGFLADVTLRTVPDPPARATALLFFAELARAGAAVAPLAEAGAAALELMDAGSLRAQASVRPFPFEVDGGMAALLVEFREPDAERLRQAVARGQGVTDGLALIRPAAFSTDAAEREEVWRLRRGLLPLVGALRPPGTAVITEDVVVPMERLAEAVADFQALFGRLGYDDAIVFGHARDGNLHFNFAQDFQDPRQVDRYGVLMRDLSDLVVQKYDGALKAEHGSGRNMAPFVRDEWGDDAYALMRAIKDLFDPHGILNPGVILNDDPLVHLRDLKSMPPISPLADRCIECGFCEPRCPSRELTTTPRQRIVITREMARLGASSDPDAPATLAALAGDFTYQGLDTCARDSMCMTSCPVRIDTGALMKELQAAAHSPRAQRTALAAARHFRLAASAARSGLRIASWLRRLPGGAALLERASGVLHRRAPALAPRVERHLALPRPAPPLRRPAAAVDGAPGVVYFPSCLSRIIGPLPGETQGATARAMLEVLERAGFAVVHPPGLDGLCCGMPFSSKAFRAAADECAARTAEALWEASDGGSRPVVTDASPCAGTLRDLAGARLAETGRTLALLDFPTFWAAHGLPRGLPVRKQRRVVLHPTCTLMKMGGMADLLACARAHADEVLVPAYAECCGFAGDRGFQVPELTASAAAHEAEEVRALTAGSAAGLYSTCRTCEIGMTRAVGQSYGSLVHLVRDTLAAAPPR
jgi:D-lactate dehydrogenase